MKKIISLMLMLAVISQFAVYAYAEADNDKTTAFEAAEILGIDTKGYDASMPATREMLATFAGAMYNCASGTMLNSRYSDMPELDFRVYYAIQAGLIKNCEADIFNPEGTITGDELAYTAVKAYSPFLTSFVGDDYFKYAVMKGFISEIQEASTVTCGQLFDTAMAVLEADAISVSNNKFETKDVSVMVDRLGIESYEGMVDDVHFDNTKLTASLSSALYGSAEAVEGTTITLDVLDGMYAAEYLGVPAKLYMKNDELLAILPQKNIAWKYGYVASVNEDTDTEASYVPSYIDKIRLVNDDTKYIADDEPINMFYNMVKTEKPVKITGRFVKLVTDGKKIVSVCAVDMDDYGYVLSTTRKEITYITDKTGRKSLNNYDSYLNKTLILNGVPTNPENLKPGSVFEYKILDEESIFIVASNMSISGIFRSCSDDYLNIDGEEIMATNVCYSSDNGNTFLEDKSKEFLGKEVSALIDPYGKCAYMIMVKENGTAPFLAAVVKAYYDENDDNYYVELAYLEENYERKQYKLNKKVKWNDGITFEDLRTFRNDINGRSIFEFTINNKDEIKEVKRALPLYGQEDIGCEISSFPDWSYCSFVYENGDTLWIDGSQEMVMLKLDNSNKLIAEEVKFSDLMNVKAESCYVNIYGYEENISPRVFVVCGDTNNMSSNTQKTGIVTNVVTAINSDDEIVLLVTVNGSVEYVADYEQAKNIEEFSLITYTDGVDKYNVSGVQINILSHIKLSEDMSNWNFTINGTEYICKTIKMADNYRMMFTDNTFIGFGKDKMTAIEYDPDSDLSGAFSNGSISSIYPGKRVFCANSPYVSMIIYEK